VRRIREVLVGPAPIPGHGPMSRFVVLPEVGPAVNKGLALVFDDEQEVTWPTAPRRAARTVGAS
jgi:hypothetical protein